jgi:hypothetical protein
MKNIKDDFDNEQLNGEQFTEEELDEFAESCIRKPPTLGIGGVLDSPSIQKGKKKERPI